MSRPRSAALTAALLDVAGGITVYAAAIKHGLDQSTIARTINPPVKAKCPTCGKTIKDKKP